MPAFRASHGHFPALGSAMTKEPILLPVAPHSVDSEFLLQIDEYRGIVEAVLFDGLGRASFFDEAENGVALVRQSPTV
jgi:hypothetical protein